MLQASAKERAAKAHLLTLFAGRREVAGYETHGRICFARGRARLASFLGPGAGLELGTS
jgi:hypothetical protein